MQPTATPNPFLVFLVAVALSIGSVSFYLNVNRKPCDCPSPHMLDDRDVEPRRPLRPRRPDGSTGSTGDVKPTILPPIVKRDM